MRCAAVGEAEGGDGGEEEDGQDHEGQVEARDPVDVAGPEGVRSGVELTVEDRYLVGGGGLPDDGQPLRVRVERGIEESEDSQRAQDVEGGEAGAVGGEPAGGLPPFMVPRSLAEAGRGGDGAASARMTGCGAARSRRGRW